MTPRRLTLLIAVLLGVFAGAMVLELTEPPGPGLDPDAVSYLGAAISVAEGHGLRIPTGEWNSRDTTTALTHFPPGIPVMIALGIRSGATPQNAARFLDAGAAAITVVCVALTAGAVAGAAGALTAAALVILTPAMVVDHASVLSEPLFLALLALFVLVLARGSADDDPAARLRRLLALSAIAAAASLVRYAGLSLVGVIVLDAWFAHRAAPRSARAKNAALTAVLPLVPFAAWVLSRPTSAEGTAVRRTGLYVAGLDRTLGEGLTTSSQWLAPGTANVIARSVLAIVVLVGLGYVFRRVLRGDASGVRRVVVGSGLVAACYMAMVIASRLVADGDIPLDDRMMSPIFVLAALAIGTTLASWWQAPTTDTVRRILGIGFTVSWLWGSAEVSKWWWDIYREDGGDFAGREWQLSALVAYARSLPPGTPIYTNWPAAIWFHTGRAARMMPKRPDPMTVARWRAKVEREQARVLVFRVESPDAAPPLAVLEFSGLNPLARLADGVVWGPVTP